MKYNPHPYQEYAARRGAAQRIIDNPKVRLFLGLGLGKTVITLTALSKLLSRSAVNKALIITPLRVAETTWSTEAAKWEHTRHLRIAKVLGSKPERMRVLGNPADLYIINRENVPWLVEHYGKKWPFDMVVIDELSSFKSHKAARFKALKSVLPYIKRLVGLTGTPAPNGLLDLWPQIYLLDKGQRLESGSSLITGINILSLIREIPIPALSIRGNLNEAQKSAYTPLFLTCVSL